MDSVEVDGAMAQLKYICERSISHQDWDRKVTELPGMLNPDLPAKHPSLVASEAITELERELPVIEEEVSILWERPAPLSQASQRP